MKSVMEKSYEQLIKEVKAHNDIAAEELYKRSYRSACCAVGALIKNKVDQEDILQETYLSAFARLDTLQNPEKFPAWVTSIATNRCKDFLKKKKPQLFSDLENEEGDVPDFKDDRIDFQPDAQMDLQSTSEIFDEMMASIPEDQRICIILYYWEGLSVAEIAASLQIPEATVKSRLNYGRKKVEIAIKAEEKKSGIKLYSVAPILMLLLKEKMKAVEIPTFSASLLAGQSSVSGTVAGSISTKATATKTVQAGSKPVIGSTVKTATGVTVKTSIVTKVAACIVAAAVLTGGVLGISAAIKHNQQSENSQPVQDEIVEPVQEDKDVWAMNCQMSKRNGDRVEIVYDGVTYWHKAVSRYSGGGETYALTLYMEQENGTVTELTDCLYGPTFYLADGKLIYTYVEQANQSIWLAFIDLTNGDEIHTDVESYRTIDVVTDKYIVTAGKLVQLADLSSHPTVKDLGEDDLALSGNNSYFYAVTSPQYQPNSNTPLLDNTINKYDSSGNLLETITVPEDSGNTVAYQDSLYVYENEAYTVCQYNLLNGEEVTTINVDPTDFILEQITQDTAGINSLDGKVYESELICADSDNLFFGYAVSEIRGEDKNILYNTMFYQFNMQTRASTLLQKRYNAAGGIGIWRP